MNYITPLHLTKISVSALEEGFDIHTTPMGIVISQSIRYSLRMFQQSMFYITPGAELSELFSCRQSMPDQFILSKSLGTSLMFTSNMGMQIQEAAE